MNNTTFKLIDSVPHLYRWKTTSSVYKLGCTSWEDQKAPVEFYSHLIAQHKYTTQMRVPNAVSICGRDFESVEAIMANSDRISLTFDGSIENGIVLLPDDNVEQPEISIWDMGEIITFNLIELDWLHTSDLFDIEVSVDNENWKSLGQFKRMKTFDGILAEMWGVAKQSIDLDLPIEARYIKIISHRRYPCFFEPYARLALEGIRFGIKTQTRELPEDTDLWWYEDSVSEIHYDEELKNRYLIGAELGVEIYKPDTTTQWGSKHYVLIPGTTTVEDIDISEIAWIEGCTFDSEEAVFAAIEMGQEAYAQWLSENDTEVAILEHQLDLETRMICQELGVEL